MLNKRHAWSNRILVFFKTAVAECRQDRADVMSLKNKYEEGHTS